MHPNNVVQQKQYRERHCDKFCKVIVILSVTDLNNQILFANINQRPTGSNAFLQKVMPLKVENVILEVIIITIEFIITEAVIIIVKAIITRQL